MNRDVLVGLVGFLILGVALVGVFRYEGAQLANASWDVAWVTESVNGPKLSGETREGQTTSAEVSLTLLNLTSAKFDLRWVDDLGSPDELELSVRAPWGETRAARSTNGSAVVAFPGIAPRPEPTRVRADTETEANARLHTAHASTNGTGAWTVSVTVVRAGDQTAPIGDLVITEDTGNAWTVGVVLDLFRPTFTRHR